MVFRKNGVVVGVVLVAVLTVLACPFMIDATYVVWSPIATERARKSATKQMNSEAHASLTQMHMNSIEKLTKYMLGDSY